MNHVANHSTKNMEYRDQTASGTSTEKPSVFKWSLENHGVPDPNYAYYPLSP
jgi:hypothetical protein